MSFPTKTYRNDQFVTVLCKGFVHRGTRHCSPVLVLLLRSSLQLACKYRRLSLLPLPLQMSPASKFARKIDIQGLFKKAIFYPLLYIPDSELKGINSSNSAT